MTRSTWSTQPTGADWNTADNWSPAEIPTDTAEFTTSSQTAITFSPTVAAIVKNIEFSDKAVGYTFTISSCSNPALTITDQGINNHSGKQQNFIVAATSSGYKNPQLKFINSACAGGDEVFYSAGPETEQGYGGGVICFCNNANAGSASFKAWTGAGTPPPHNTVGGEISFCDSASAANARFMIYGSLGADGDTFGNVVFHDSASAANASFTNVGGTVSGGDGGNTQFYGDSTAATAVFYNRGGTHSKANGGDVAFDSNANGGHGHYYNYAASAAAAYGGVTSFNNNPPHMPAPQGASAGHGSYFNFGARYGEQGGGGHLEFSARYGSPTAADATIVNYGSSLENRSSAGHTIFSINLPTEYFPTAGNATIWNHPGISEGGAAGFTEFSVYGSGNGANAPSAGNGKFFNLGAYTSNTAGGYTAFSGSSVAANATLVAYGGVNGGYGGKIAFYDESSGGSAQVQLFGNGELDISNHSGEVTLGSLELCGGVITIQLGDNLTTLSISDTFTLNSGQASFSLWKKDQAGFAFNTAYTILTSSNLHAFTADQFNANSIEGIQPSFMIVDNKLQVSYMKN